MPTKRITSSLQENDCLLPVPRQQQDHSQLDPPATRSLSALPNLQVLQTKNAQRTPQPPPPPQILLLPLRKPPTQQTHQRPQNKRRRQRTAPRRHRPRSELSSQERAPRCPHARAIHPVASLRRRARSRSRDGQRADVGSPAV